MLITRTKMFFKINILVINILLIRKGEKMNKNINKIEELLIVVDMVNGFVVDGPMADSYIQTIIPPIRREMVKFTKDETKDVVVIKEGHNKGAVEFNSYPEHCVIGTKEAELVDGLKDLEPYAHIYLKNSTSAIWADGFMDLIKQYVANPKFKRIIITGCCTDICIMNLAIPLKMFFNQFNIDVEVMIPENAVETFNIPGVHERKEWNSMALKMLQQAGIKIYNSDYQLLEQLLNKYGVPNHEYSIGYEAEQRMCLVKEDDVYKLFSVERGNRFGVETYDTYESAAIALIRYVAEEYEDIIKEFKNEMDLGYQKTKKN